MTAAPNERVTVWFVYVPWREDKPVVKSIEGTKTAKQIKLDFSHPQGHSRIIPERQWAGLAYTEIDAVRTYVERAERDLARERDLLAIREEAVRDAHELLARIEAAADG